ncbi:MAG: S41 family peptidase [Ardenticatenaceae bacterium]|nr:S41 family peptidase [Ardenticatenaceae bacterium]
MNARRLTGWLVTVLVTVLLTVPAFMAGWGASGFVQSTVRAQTAASPTVAGTGPSAAATTRDGIDLKVLWEAVTLLQQHFYGRIPGARDLTYAAIRGVVAATNDQHTAFVDPEQARLLDEDLQGEFDGIGATVRMENDELMIVATLPKSPAEHAGLVSGDIVLRVNDTPLKGKSLIEAISLIRGPRGTNIHLTVRREGASGLLEFDIVRDRILVPVVESRVIQGEDGKPLGYLKLNDFGARAPEEVKKALSELKAQDVNGLILDLRNNPGGYLSSAVEVSSQFIGDGTILTEKGSSGRDQIHRAESGGLALDIPLVVLVNEGSASASEILAGAVQDTGRGTLIGTKTFGKGSVQITNQLSDGSSLRVTVAHWFTPKGRAIHEVGIEPEIVVERTPADLKAGRDPQLDRAISFFAEKDH